MAWYSIVWYGMIWLAWYGMVGLVHLTRPNATKISVGADGHGREAQTNVGSHSSQKMICPNFL